MYQGRLLLLLLLRPAKNTHAMFKSINIQNMLQEAYYICVVLLHR